MNKWINHYTHLFAKKETELNIWISPGQITTNSSHKNYDLTQYYCCSMFLNPNHMWNVVGILDPWALWLARWRKFGGDIAYHCWPRSLEGSFRLTDSRLTPQLNTGKIKGINMLRLWEASDHLLARTSLKAVAHWQIKTKTEWPFSNAVWLTQKCP